MASNKSPDVSEDKRNRQLDNAKMGGLSLEEFKLGMIGRGFEESSGSRTILYNPSIPDFRFVIVKRVVRLEKKVSSSTGRKWQLDSSYLISHQLQIAISAVDSLDFESEKISKRKEISSRGGIISLSILGSVLCVGGLLFVLIPESANLFLAVLFLGLGIMMLVQVRNWLIRNRKFSNCALHSVALVIEREKREDPDSYRSEYYLTIGFTPSELETTEQRVWIKAQVKENLYSSCLRGSTIEIQYACEDPRIVILECE